MDIHLPTRYCKYDVQYRYASAKPKYDPHKSDSCRFDNELDSAVAAGQTVLNLDNFDEMILINVRVPSMIHTRAGAITYETAQIYEWRTARIQHAMLDMPYSGRSFACPWCAHDPQTRCLHTGLSHCDCRSQKVTITLAEVRAKQDDDIEAGRLGRKALRQLRLNEDHQSGKKKVISEQVEVSLC